ncbi:MAG TPA: TetR family transcriptional regulator C-terminal domain-containing protein [Actinomycetes bacterium]|nr:TetR family transcriptional regulator C-terminal domain-containing protein [Actinomycetes bacterium]
MDVTAVKRKGRPLEHDRAELLRAARAVAAARGFDSLRFADVSAATGVPVSSLQYAFGTRESLVREVLRTGVADELARLRDAVDGEPDPWRRIERFIRLGISIDDERRREGWLLWMEYWRAALRDAELREESGATTRGWRMLLTRAVDDGVAAGQFHIEGSAEEIAASLVALVDGMSLQVLVGDSPMKSGRAIRAAVRSARRMLGMDAA